MIKSFKKFKQLRIDDYYNKTKLVKDYDDVSNFIEFAKKIIQKDHENAQKERLLDDLRKKNFKKVDVLDVLPKFSNLEIFT